MLAFQRIIIGRRAKTQSVTLVTAACWYAKNPNVKIQLANDSVDICIEATTYYLSLEVCICSSLVG
jgi:hypothetical protein